MKTQNIRLADVFAIGPLMVWGGMKLREDNPLLGPALAALGAATVWYNGRNYLRVRSGDRIEGGSAAGHSASSLDPPAATHGHHGGDGAHDEPGHSSRDCDGPSR